LAAKRIFPSAADPGRITDNPENALQLAHSVWRFRQNQMPCSCPWIMDTDNKYTREYTYMILIINELMAEAAGVGLCRGIENTQVTDFKAFTKR
jgi:hypothetical protein